MKGAYRTKAREEILSFLKEHTEQRFTAKEILTAVSERADGINKTTVYRNLDRLCEAGDLLKLKEPNQDSWFYQYSLEQKHCDQHMHAQCNVCGRIYHLDSPFVKTFEQNLLEECGLMMDPAKTVIFGTCETCRTRKE
ncbi:MAG: transcriptional repressor [Lachnospiraceae bacterium]|nr:transcriptional repressor [Lachnospiraceae bacterium]